MLEGLHRKVQPFFLYLLQCGIAATRLRPFTNRQFI